MVHTVTAAPAAGPRGSGLARCYYPAGQVPLMLSPRAGAGGGAAPTKGVCVVPHTAPADPAGFQVFPARARICTTRLGALAAH